MRALNIPPALPEACKRIDHTVYVGQCKPRLRLVISTAAQSLLVHMLRTVHHGCAAMTTQEVIARGRKEIKATGDSLLRSEKVVADTIEIATKTAETLHEQGKQMDRVLDDLGKSNSA